jgi:hypothetical protein
VFKSVDNLKLNDFSLHFMTGSFYVCTDGKTSRETQYNQYALYYKYPHNLQNVTLRITEQFFLTLRLYQTFSHQINIKINVDKEVTSILGWIKL